MIVKGSANRKALMKTFAKAQVLCMPLRNRLSLEMLQTATAPTGAMVTLAGLLIDENQRVLDINDPIPG
jgi:hypothetical protein